jgi:hypothetical protein
MDMVQQDLLEQDQHLKEQLILVVELEVQLQILQTLVVQV